MANGYNKLSIRTVDTDLVVLAVASVQRIDVMELWIAFGTGRNFRFLAAHEMARALGPDRCIALPMFHAFTGCDTISCFAGRGKKTAWDTWSVYETITKAFCSLMEKPESVNDNMKSLERFVILMYDRTSSLNCVNQVRKQLFTQKGRSIESIPPTKAALLQHSRRATYQASYCWGQALKAVQDLPCPSNWGWKINELDGWQICWSTLPEASKACRELLRCGCKKGCSGRCKCAKAAPKCTALCFCGGECI